MVRKAKESPAADKGAAGLFDSALAGSVRDSAQQIWLAGMGAFAKAQAEGKQVFDALVKEGMTLQQKTHAAAEERFADVSSKMQGVAEEVSSKSRQQWGRLESIFEERTAQALKKLGVPSARDVQALSDRVDALARQLGAQTRTAPRAGARKAAAKTAGTRTAAKRAAPKAA